MGLLWALMSVALVSAAQLTLRTAMTTLPSAEQPWVLGLYLLHFGDGTLALLLGLLGVVLIVGGVITIFWPNKSARTS